jgi:hypothetical protein
MNIGFALSSTWGKKVTAAIAALLVGLTAQLATAAEYTFAWAANPPPVTGYRLYYKKDGYAGPPFYGTDAAEGASPLPVGNNTSITISGLDDNATYHFALTAVYGDEESAFSQTITVTPSVVEDPRPDPKVLMTVQMIQMLLVLDDEE